VADSGAGDSSRMMEGDNEAVEKGDDQAVVKVPILTDGALIAMGRPADFHSR
jgi:hypothetical protein